MNIKKMTALIMAAVIGLALTACGNAADENASEIISEAAASATKETDPKAADETTEIVTEIPTETETSAETEAETETETETEVETEETSAAVPEAIIAGTVGISVNEETRVSDTNGVQTSDENVSDWKAIYKAELEKYFENDYNIQDMGFELFDVDSDGIPELFVSMASFHAGGVEIYTVSEGAAFDLGMFGSWGECSASDEGVILSEYSGMGAYTGVYYRKSGTDITELIRVQEYYEEDPCLYTINGEYVTQEEYSIRLKKYQDLKWSYLGNEYKLTEDNLNEVFG